MADRAPGHAPARSRRIRCGVELVPPVGELVGHPLAVAAAFCSCAARSRRAGRRSPLVKQESQRCHALGALSPGRSPAVLDRGAEAGGADHRAIRRRSGSAEATSSHRGCSKIALQQLLQIVSRVHMAAPCAGPQTRPTASAAASSPRWHRRPLEPISPAISAPELRSPPRPGIRGAPAPTSSVSARSNPFLTLGPVSIETQKQVPPGSPAVHGDDESLRCGAPGSAGSPPRARS